MNRNRYRLVFDKRTGMLVPVAEFTASAKKGSGGGLGEGMGDTAAPRWSRLCAAVALACWGGLSVPLSLHAQTVPDPSNGVTVTETANGVPLVNIVDPNGTGLSHNKFLDFNVGTEGLVFNNSLVDGVSGLGGYTMKNPHLTREANGILVEVTGDNVSRLLGGMESFGGKADLMISAKEGVYLNGASAVNIDRLTVTTGTPTGNGRAFEIHGGAIEIDGDGVDVRNTTVFDVVARAIRVNGQLRGSDTGETHVVAGLNTFDATTGAVHKRENGGGAGAPAYAIDGGAVGAMHGRHVTLVSTESGLGVRHEGALTAVTDIEISVEGDLRLRGFHAQNVALAAEDVSIGGADRQEERSTRVDATLDVAARGDLLLAGNHEATRFALDVDGTLVSNGRVEAVERAAGDHAVIDVRAGGLTLASAAEWKAVDGISAHTGGMQVADGARMSARSVSLSADGTLDTSGQVTANGDLRVAGGLVVNRGTLQGESIHVDATQLHNIGQLRAGDALDVTLGEGESRNAGGMEAGQALTLQGVRATLVNTGDLLANDQLLIELGTLDNRSGAIAWSTNVLMRLDRLENTGAVYGGTLDIRSAWLRNAGPDASIYAEEDARFDIAQDLENTGDATLYAARNLTIDADGNVRNTAGATLAAGTQEQLGAVALRAGGDLVNTGDATIYGDTVDLAVEGTLRNEADIVGFDTLTVDAGAVDNAGQLHGHDVAVTTTGALTNRDGGSLTATDTLDMTVGGTLANRGANSVIGADTVTATTGDVDNRDGALLQGETRLALDAGHVANQSVIQAGATLTLDAASLDNTGTIAAHDIDATTQGDLVNRAGGRIQAGNLLQANVGGDLSNRGADSAMLGATVEVDVAGAADNADNALLQASRALSLSAARLANRNAKILAGTVDPDSGAVVSGAMLLETTHGDVVNDAGGQVMATGTAWIDAAGNVHNGVNARIAADNVFVSATGDLANAAGATIEAVGRTDLQLAGTLDNDGRVAGQRVWIEADAALDNSGQVVGGDWIEADTKALRNAAGGSIEAKNDVVLSTETFANTGRIHSADRTTLTIENDLDLTLDANARNATADGRLTIHARDLTILHELVNPGHVVLDAKGSIRNVDGILTGGTLLASAGGAFTNESLVWAAEDIDIEAASLRNTAGSEIEATRNLWIVAGGEFVNEAGARVAAGGDGAIDAQVLRNEVSYDGTGVRKVGDARGESQHNDGHNTYKFWIGTKRLYGGVGQGYYWANHGAGLAILGSDLTVTDQGMIETGGTLRINQGTKHGQDAQVINQGHILAGGNLLIDGDVDNVGVTASESLMDYLRRPTYLQISAGDNDGFVGKSAEFDSLYDLLSDVFDETWTRGLGMAGKYWHSYEVANAIKAMNNAQLNKVMSLVFGPDWRAVPYDHLVNIWNSVKRGFTVRDGMEALADRGAEIMAGGTIDHTGGHFRNLGGGQQRQNQDITVNIGGEQVTTIGGSFDVLTNVRELTQALDARAALDKLTAEGNKKYRPAPPRPDLQPIDWAQLPPPTGPIGIPVPPVSVHLLYEERPEFTNVGNFYDSQYFFDQIGFNTGYTVTVVGGGRFINEMVQHQISGEVAGFLTAQDGVTGALRTKKLMDAAGVEGPRLGLQVGVEPTQAQLDQLQDDIVWMVAEEVNGQLALVPRVYVSAKTVAAKNAERAAGGATVAARQHVFIDADEGGVTNHNGTIRAGGSLDIVSAGTVENIRDNGLAGGGLRASEGLFIDGIGDVRNLGGVIEGRHVAITTEGNFTDEVRMGYNDRGDLVVGQQSQIRGGGADPVVPALPADQVVDGVLHSALSAPGALAGSRAVTMTDGATATAPTPPAPPAGSVTIKAKGDVTLVNSDIRARNVHVESEEGDLLARGVHEVTSSFEHERQGGFLTSVSTTTTRAEATAGGSTVRGAADGGTLVLKAGNDLTLEGGEYGADTGLLRAGGDVTIKTARDYTHEETRTVAEGLSVGVRAGVGGATASAQYGPGGASVSATGSGQANPPATGGLVPTSGKPIQGQALGAEFGYRRIETTETRSTIENHNANLDFGAGVAIIADDTVDFGGADIRAQRGEGDDAVKGDVLIEGKHVTTTKYEDVDHRTSRREETFVGFRGTGNSSIVDAVTQSMLLADKVDQGMTLDQGRTAGQAAAMATNLAFNEVGGANVTAGVEHTIDTSTRTDRSENITTVVGDIVIRSTGGDIDLRGVQLDGNGAGVVLDSARDIRVASAQSRTEGTSSRESHQVQVGAGVSATPFGVGAGYSVGYDGERSDTTFSGTSHTNSSIVGGNVRLVSQGDTTLEGANVVAAAVELDVKGDMAIKSVQDTYNEETTRAKWGASAGVAVNTQSILSATGAAQASGGRSWENSALTAEQSGIQAGTISGTVGGDLTLKGAHLVATDRAPVGETGQEAGLHVAGAIVSEALTDKHDKEGYEVGGGGGLSKYGGLASVTVVNNNDDRKHFEANQLNTISGVPVTSGKGTTGPINTDADNMVDVVRDDNIAGNQMSFTVGIADIKSKTNRPKTQRKTETPDTPTPAPASRRQSTNSQADDAPDTTAAVIERNPSVRSRPSDEAVAQNRAAPVRPDDVDVRVDDAAPTRPASVDGDVIYTRGERLHMKSTKPVPPENVKKVSDDLYVIIGPDGKETGRYVDRNVVDGNEVFFEAGMVNKVNNRPSTLDDVRTLTQTHDLLRQTSAERRAVGGDTRDTMIAVPKDRDDAGNAFPAPEPDYNQGPAQSPRTIFSSGLDPQTPAKAEQIVNELRTQLQSRQSSGEETNPPPSDTPSP